MKKIRCLFGVAVVVGLFIQSGAAEETAVPVVTTTPELAPGLERKVTTGSLSLDFMSAYVWRGAVLNNAAVIEPSLTVTTPIDLYFNVWGNMDATTKQGQQWEFTEWDFLVAYPVTLKWVKLEVGVIEYDFPKEGAIIDEGRVRKHDYDTREGYFQAKGLCLLEPTIKVFYDFDEVNGFYGYAGIGHTVNLTEKLSLLGTMTAALASARYNKAYYGEDSTRFNDLNLGLVLGYALNSSISFALKGSFSTMLDGVISSAARDNFGYDSFFYGGVNATYSF